MVLETDISSAALAGNVVGGTGLVRLLHASASRTLVSLMCRRARGNAQHIVDLCAKSDKSGEYHCQSLLRRDAEGAKIRMADPLTTHVRNRVGGGGSLCLRFT